jgi:hypothetical protein
MVPAEQKDELPDTASRALYRGVGKRKSAILSATIIYRQRQIVPNRVLFYFSSRIILRAHNSA